MRLASAPFGHKLHAFERRNLLAQRARQIFKSFFGSPRREDTDKHRGLFAHRKTAKSLPAASAGANCRATCANSSAAFNQHRRRDRAFGDGNNRMRPSATIAWIPRRIECQANAIAITPRLAGQRRNLCRRMHAASFQRLPQNGPLEVKLPA